MGARAVRHHQEEMRKRQLDRFGESGDLDLLDGRFAKKVPRKPRNKLHDSGTSSTRPSTQIGDHDEYTLAGEEAIKNFIGKELNLFFSMAADAQLFVKVIVSDGIVT